MVLLYIKNGKFLFYQRCFWVFELEVALRDGTIYLPYRYKLEKELENIVIENIEKIFSSSVFFLGKKIIESATNIKAVPDGFIIDLIRKKWYLIEIELAIHSPYEHIIPQLTKFSAIIKNQKKKKNLLDSFYEEIKNHEKITLLEIKGELYKALTDTIERDPELVVIIDEKTKRFEEALSALSDLFNSKVKIVEFKTYKRKNTNDCIHVFNTLFESEIELKPEIVITEGSSETINQILEVSLLVLKYGYKLNSALKEVAKNRDIKESTVRDKLTRQIGLNMEGFRQLLNDKNKLTAWLIERFPNDKDLIVRVLGDKL